MYNNLNNEVEELYKEYTEDNDDRELIDSFMKRLRKLLVEHDNYLKGAVVWCADDIIERARENKKWYRVPSRKEAQQILEYMIHKHDATIGINWDVIDCYLPRKGTKPFENSNVS